MNKLVEKEQHFKLLVTKKLEAIIRYLCIVSPDTEYSGVLFYDVEGAVDTNDLRIIAKDFCLLDIGSVGFTTFQMTPEVANYMMENDLLDAKQGLMHSHNKMNTFFSGTDKNTLLQEGSDTNHFVSLIVNNAGKYTAAITKKVTKHIVGEALVEYPTYNGTITLKQPIDQEMTDIEYYPLDIEIENPQQTVEQFNILSKQNKQKAQKSQTAVQQFLFPQEVPNAFKAAQKPIVKQPLLFEEDDTPLIEDNTEVEALIEDLVKKHISQMLTGSLKEVDLKDLPKIAGESERLYSQRFKSEDAFQVYANNMVDNFIEEVDLYCYDDQGGYNEEIHMIYVPKMVSALEALPSNVYIETFIEILNRY